MSHLEKLIAALLGIVVLMHFAPVQARDERNYVFLPDMVDSPAYESQASNPIFADGKTLQAPPPGAIARGFAPFAIGGEVLSTTGLFKDLSEQQKAAWNRFAQTARAAGGGESDAQAAAAGEAARATARGRFVFTAYCAVCHGPGGAGDGPVTKRGVPPPTSLLAEGAKTMSDGQMFRLISFGRANMAAYGPFVSRSDRWDVIRYIRTLQEAR